MFDKKVRRGTLTLPKAHSFGFGVRVQDRLHQDILTVQDRCLMTITFLPFPYSTINYTINTV